MQPYRSTDASGRALARVRLHAVQLTQLVGCLTDAVAAMRLAAAYPQFFIFGRASRAVARGHRPPPAMSASMADAMIGLARLTGDVRRALSRRLNC